MSNYRNEIAESLQRHPCDYRNQVDTILDCIVNNKYYELLELFKAIFSDFDSKQKSKNFTQYTLNILGGIFINFSSEFESSVVFITLKHRQYSMTLTLLIILNYMRLTIARHEFSLANLKGFVLFQLLTIEGNEDILNEYYDKFFSPSHVFSDFYRYARNQQPHYSSFEKINNLILKQVSFRDHVKENGKFYFYICHDILKSHHNYFCEDQNHLNSFRAAFDRFIEITSLSGETVLENIRKVYFPRYANESQKQFWDHYLNGCLKELVEENTREVLACHKEALAAANRLRLFFLAEPQKQDVNTQTRSPNPDFQTEKSKTPLWDTRTLSRSRNSDDTDETPRKKAKIDTVTPVILNI